MSITKNPHLLFLITLTFSVSAYAVLTDSPVNLPSDAVSLLSFKSKADLDNKLLYVLNERFDYCQWQGVKCVQGRVVSFVLQTFHLRGVFEPDTLTRLDQLQVLNLQNNSLAGPIPDLSGLVNLKSLFLGLNSFSGAFPQSILALHRLQTLDLSFNNFTGPIPENLSSLDRLASLRLELNRFDGSVPALNQSSLKSFNVTGNNLTGPIPMTPTLSRFNSASFSQNPDLCGEIINKPCKSLSPFFEPPVLGPPSRPSIQSDQSQSILVSPPSSKNHKKTGLILGLSIGVAVLLAALLCLFAAIKIQRSPPTSSTEITAPPFPSTGNPNSTAKIEEENGEIQIEAEKINRANNETIKKKKRGDLIFCAGEAPLYSLDQLMRGSAELLGRGTIGTTYKAVLSNQLIVTVKRIDASRTADTSSEEFERQMDAVGELRHPNLVPVRAYFQAKGERLVIYDYQPNGSLFNLIHGSRSTRAKPLHWTSCLKIAEDVAQGLAYIHNHKSSTSIIHGNLKSSNILLGHDFEACLTDYGLSLLTDASHDDPDSIAYKAPETRHSSHHRATAKVDVYAFGVLLLELLTGKHPSQQPFLLPEDVPEWVWTVRDGGAGGDSDRLEMLTEVASVCCLTTPEQRPAMVQVLKMIEKIKETVMVDDDNDSPVRY